MTRHFFKKKNLKQKNIATWKAKENHKKWLAVKKWGMILFFLICKDVVWFFLHLYNVCSSYVRNIVKSFSKQSVMETSLTDGNRMGMDYHMKVSQVSQMRAMDHRMIEQFNMPAQLLMENAGLAAYSVVKRYMEVEGQYALVICGLGNNGGDGFVVARKLISDGGTPKVCLLGKQEQYRGSAKANLKIIAEMGIEIIHLESAETIAAEAACCDMIVDAVFGTGLDRPVEGVYRDVIEWINHSGKPVFSIDIPSGIHGNTGQCMGVAVKADYTISFGLPKIGNLLYPGYAHGGKLFVSHISFPPALYQSNEISISLNTPAVLPPRMKHGHKGTFGQVLFVSGASHYFGAPYFASAAFLKAGGGYSRLATPRSLAPFIAGKAPELVMLPQEETADGSIALKNKDKLLELADQMDMVVIGPGLSLNDETCRLVRELVREIHKPILVDGDGLTAVCGYEGDIQKRSSETILTPHMGEMARLTRRSVSEIEADPVPILQNA
jgi:NAD(P)H-hydrate epimerase